MLYAIVAAIIIIITGLFASREYFIKKIEKEGKTRVLWAFFATDRRTIGGKLKAYLLQSTMRRHKWSIM